MKNFIFSTLIIIVISISGCVFIGHRVNGNGNVIKENRDLASFHAVHVEGSMNVYVVQGEAKPAVIEAEENIIPYLETTVDNGRLFIHYRDNTWVSAHKEVKVYITAPAIDELHMEGSGEIIAQNKIINDHQLWIGVTGSEDKKADVNAPLIKASIAGSGNIDASGETKNVQLDITGSGDYNGYELMTENAKATVTGSGNAYVSASMQLEAHITGSGDINYKGEPQINKNITGSGDVIKK